MLFNKTVKSHWVNFRLEIGVHKTLPQDFQTPFWLKFLNTMQCIAIRKSLKAQ